MSDTSELLIRLAVLFPCFVLNSWLAVQIYKWNLRRRETQFLKQLKLVDSNRTISFIAVESSDKAAMKSIKQQLANEESKES